MSESMLKSMFSTGLNLDFAFVFTFIFGVSIIYIFYYLLRGNVKEDDKLLEDMLNKFNPEPLVNLDNEYDDTSYWNSNIVNDKIGTIICVNNKNCLNLGSDNFYNLVKNERITDEAVNIIKKYGVGSCGPRGFYGTVDVHLDLEERIAKFMNMEEAVVYSYWFSTVSSAIPAYCKRNDVIFCDEMISFAAKMGLDAAKCKVIYFKHNDATDLEKKIIDFNLKVAKSNKSDPRKFLILEGIYYNTGNICNLPPLVDLRSKYKMRLFLDESISIGVLGATGRGIIEHYKINPADIDMVIGSLEGLLGSVGGFCVGSHFIIEHQRLSGLGYCFSASLPPVLTRAAYCGFDYLDENCAVLCEQLRLKSIEFHRKLKITGMQVFGNERSPLKYLCFMDVKGEPRNDREIYKEFVQLCLASGLAVIAIKNTSTKQWQIKITVNIDFTSDDFDAAVKIMRNAAAQCFFNY